MADISLLFDVQREGGVGKGTEETIRSQLQDIVDSINAKPFKIQFEADASKITKQIEDAVSGDKTSKKRQSNTQKNSKAYKEATQAINQYYAKLKQLNLAEKEAFDTYNKTGKTDVKYSSLIAELNHLKTAYDNAIASKNLMTATERSEITSLDTRQQLEFAAAIEKRTNAILQNKAVMTSSETVMSQANATLARCTKAEHSHKQSSRDAVAAIREKMIAVVQAQNAVKAGSATDKEAAIKVRALQDATKDLRLALKENYAIIQQNGDATKTLGERLVGLGKKFSQWLGVSQLIMAAYRAVRKMITAVVELDTAMTELKKVTDETDETYQRFLESASTRAKKLGASLTDVVKTTADFARLGFSLEEAEVVSDAALVYKNVGDGIKDIDQASESLISTMQAFGVEAKDVMSIVDKFNTTGNKFAISSGGVGDALLNSAAALNAAGNSLDESIGLITAANTTIQNPEKVGTALKTVSMYLRAAKTEAEDAGESTEGMANSVSELRGELLALTNNRVDIQIDEDNFKSTYDVLRDLSKVWNDLSDISKANITEMIGGKRNANVISALLKDFEKAEEVVTQTAGSAGSALEENEKVLESIQGKINVLSATFETFSQNLIGSGTIKFFVDFATGVLNVLDAFAKLNTLLPAVIGNFLIFKAAGVAKNLADMKAQVSVVTQSLIAQKGATEQLTAKVLGLTLAEKQELVTQLNKAVERKALTAAEKDAILAELGLTGTATSLTVANKGLATSFKSVMASIPVWGWIALGITVVIEAVTALASWVGTTSQSISKLDNELNDLISTAQTATNEFSSLKASADEIIPRFTELAKGVDEFGNKVDLTDEEYAEFLELNNKLAEMFPQLDMGLDSNGNHILALSYSIETLTESLKSLIEAERAAANEKVADNMKDTIKNMKTADKAYKKEERALQNRKDYYQEAYNEINRMYEDQDKYKATYGDRWKEQYQIDTSQYLYKMQQAWGDSDNWYQMVEKYERDGKIDWHAVINSDEFKNQMAGVERQMDTVTKNQKARWQKLNPIMGAWLQTTDDYTAAGENAQQLLTKIIGNVDYSSIGITNEKKLKEYLTTNFIKPITQAKPEVQNAMVGMFDLKSAFDSGMLTVGEYGVIDYILGDLEAEGISNDILNNLKDALNLEDFTKRKTEVTNGIKDFSKDAQDLANKIRSAADEYNKLVNGNVDYTKRPLIEPEKMIGAGWEEFKDEIATTYTQGMTIGEGDARYTLSITPILENGKVLSPEELDEYVGNLVTDGGTDKLLESDYLNLVVNVDEGDYDEGYWTKLEDNLQRIKDKHWDLVKQLREETPDGSDILIKFGSIEEYINSLSASELNIAYEIINENGSITLDELHEKIRQVRYESANMVEPLNMNDFVTGLDKTAEAVNKIASAMANLEEGTALTKGQLMELVEQYPQLLKSANLFTDGSIEGQKNMLQAILDTYEAEYDAQIDTKIAELEATEQVLNNQLELEAKKANVIQEIENMSVNGQLDQEEKLVGKISELNDLQGQNYVDFKDGELQVNEEALNDELAQGADFGTQATENIWQPYATAIVTSHEKGYSGGLKATNSYGLNLFYKLKNIASNALSAFGNAVSDAMSGNWKGIGHYFSSAFGGGGTDVSGGTVSVNFGGSAVTVGGQDLDGWISDQKKASDKRIDAINEIKADTINSINNLKALKGLKLSEVYGSKSKSKSGSGSKDKSDKDKDKENIFKTMYEYHKHLVAMEQETTSDFLKWLDDAYKAAYKQGEITLDEYYKYEEEVFKGMQELRDEAKDALDELIEYRIDMLKQDIENEKEALDKKLDNLKEFYDKQKEMLQDQYDEEKRLEEQSEKRKAVSDIRAELSMLENDDSAWAQKRKLELQAELSDAESELADFEKESALDKALNAIDEAYNSQEAQLEREMEALDEKLNDPNALYNQALNDIRNNSKNQLYYQMLMYNRQYGDGKDETVKELWESTYGALGEYENMFGKLYMGVDLKNETGYKSPTTSDKNNKKKTSTNKKKKKKSTETYPYGKASATSGNIQQGASGSDVKAIQYALNKLGYGNSGTKDVDGIFGSGTASAVKAFQKAMGIAQDGIVGKNTRAKFKSKGYASGTKHATAGLHELYERGAETLFVSGDGSKYRILNDGDKVFNADATNFLYDFANSGGGVLEQMLKNVFSGAGLDGITPTIVSNEIKMGDIIVQGSANERTVSEIRRAQRESVDFMLKEFTKLNK